MFGNIHHYMHFKYPYLYKCNKSSSSTSLAFVREFTGDRWIPPQRTSNVESSSISIEHLGHPLLTLLSCTAIHINSIFRNDQYVWFLRKLITQTRRLYTSVSFTFAPICYTNIDTILIITFPTRYTFDVHVTTAYRCNYNGEDCTRDGFNQTITDFGVCYVFNAGPDIRQSTNPGVTALDWLVVNS